MPLAPTIGFDNQQGSIGTEEGFITSWQHVHPDTATCGHRRPGIRQYSPAQTPGQVVRDDENRKEERLTTERNGEDDPPANRCQVPQIPRETRSIGGVKMRSQPQASKLLNSAALILVGIVGFCAAVPALAVTYDGTTVVAFSANPATLSGDNTPDVTITTTTTAPGASPGLIDAGKVVIQLATDGIGNPVPAASVVTWEALNAPGQTPTGGVTSLDVDLDALGFVPGMVGGFRAHYVTGGGRDKVNTHFSEPVDLVIAAAWEGLSHGYWKNHSEDWPPTGYSPSQTLGSVFAESSSLGLGSYTLLEALDFAGGSTLAEKAQILLRQAVASVLNAGHPNINYPRTAAEVIADANAALGSGDEAAILALETALDVDNNLGGDLSS